MLRHPCDVVLRGGRAGSLHGVGGGANLGGSRAGADDDCLSPLFVLGLPTAPNDSSNSSRAAAAGTTITAASFAPTSSSSGGRLLVLGTSAGDALAVRVRGGGGGGSGGARFRAIGPPCAPRDRGLALAPSSGAVGSPPVRAQAVTSAAFLPSSVALGYGDGRLRLFGPGDGGGGGGGCELSTTALPPAAAAGAARGAPVSCLSSGSQAASPLLLSVTAQGAALWRGSGSNSLSGSTSSFPPPPPARPAPVSLARSFPADPYPARWAAVTPDSRAVLMVGGEGAGGGAANSSTRRRPPSLPAGRERGAVLTALAVDDGRMLARAALPLALPEDGDDAAWPTCFALSPDGSTLAVGYASAGGSGGEVGSTGGGNNSGSSSGFHVLMVDVATFQAARWLVLTPQPGPVARPARPAPAVSAVRQLAFLPGGRALAALVTGGGGSGCSAVVVARADTGAVDGAVPLAAAIPDLSLGASSAMLLPPPLLFALDEAGETLAVVGGAAEAPSPPAGGTSARGCTVCGRSAVAVYDVSSLRESWWRRREEARPRRAGKGGSVQASDVSWSGSVIAVGPPPTAPPNAVLAPLPPSSDSAPPPPFRTIAGDKAAHARAAAEAAAAAARPPRPPPPTARLLLQALRGCEGGAFPQRHRARIWSRLLRLPENDAAFAALDAMGDDDGEGLDEEEEEEGQGEERGRRAAAACSSSSSSSKDAVLLAQRRKRAEARVKRVADALERWFPPLGEPYVLCGGSGEQQVAAAASTTATATTLAARLARPLCSRAAFGGRDARAAFEAAATLLLHWCGGWLDWCPGPPLRLIRRVFALLSLQQQRDGGEAEGAADGADPAPPPTPGRELADALLWRAPLPVAAAATSGAWDWLSAAGGGEALRPADWARVWDRVLCEGAAAGSGKDGEGAPGHQPNNGSSSSSSGSSSSSSSPVELLYHFFVAWMLHHRQDLLRLAREAAMACGECEGGDADGDPIATCSRRRRRADAALHRLRAFFSARHPLPPGCVSQLLQHALSMRAATPPEMLVGADAALAPPARMLKEAAAAAAAAAAGSAGGDSSSSSNKQSPPGALPRAPAQPSAAAPVVVSESYPPPRGWPLASAAAMREARQRAAAVEAALERGEREAARLSALERALEHDLMALAPGRSARLRGELGRAWRGALLLAVQQQQQQQEGDRGDDSGRAAATAHARRAAVRIATARAEEREAAAMAERHGGRGGRGVAIVGERHFGDDGAEDGRGAEFAWRSGRGGA